jgi:hypothetical protein
MDECWKKTWSNDKSRYYYTNIETGKSQWGLPLDKGDDILPKGWEMHESKTQNRIYFGYTEKQITQWDAPNFVREKAVQLPPGWEEFVSKCGNKYYVNTDRRISIWADDLKRVESELRLKSTPKSTAKSKIEINLRPLDWIGNSCYLDSTLFAFLAGPKSFIHDFLNINIQKELISVDMKKVCYPDDYGLENRKAVQRELKRIDNSMRGEGPYVENCTALRATLKNCRGESGQTDPFWFWIGEGTDPKTLSKFNSRDGTAESGEFLAHLLKIIPHNQAIKHTINYVTNDDSIEKFDNEEIKKSLENGTMFMSSEMTDNKASIIHFINGFTLLDIPKKGTDINSLLVQIEDSGLDENVESKFGGTIFKRRVTVQTIVHTPYLIVSLKRLIADEYLQVGAAGLKVIRTPIYPNEIVYIGDEAFTISAIVMNTSAAHYTAIAKYGDFWYYYNDSPNATIKKYTTFEQVIDACVNTKGMINPITNGTQYYYKPLIER